MMNMIHIIHNNDEYINDQYIYSFKFPSTQAPTPDPQIRLDLDLPPRERQPGTSTRSHRTGMKSQL